MLKQEPLRVVEQAVLDANREEAHPVYQQELATWEWTLADGVESS